ncbi:uncharacterized protein LOC123879016 [Maniola jurtina]|uniref:uncharacterized protein LOC123879016 n=1 Tax=Maniola jurtina TaxID=191418 RepID=UPI001E68BB15|nr:uncharacterized protein LOC123879016 [Maniola jurtina]
MFNFMRLSFTWTPTDLFSIVDPRYLFWTLILISIWLLSTMPLDRKCCVPNCSNTRLDGTILHRFPNPEKDPDRFRTWLYAIGGDILALDNKTIHKYGRICHHHFQARFHTASNRLCANATPTLNLPGFLIKRREPQQEVGNINVEIISQSDKAEDINQSKPSSSNIGRKPLQEIGNINVEIVGQSDKAEDINLSNPSSSDNLFTKKKYGKEKIHQPVFKGTLIVKLQYHTSH